MSDDRCTISAVKFRRTSCTVHMLRSRTNIYAATTYVRVQSRRAFRSSSGRFIRDGPRCVVRGETRTALATRLNRPDNSLRIAVGADCVLRYANGKCNVLVMVCVTRVSLAASKLQYSVYGSVHLPRFSFRITSRYDEPWMPTRENNRVGRFPHPPSPGGKCQIAR